MNPVPDQVEVSLGAARERLLKALQPDGRWVGRLSSSALAGAVASLALHLNGREVAARHGQEWLAEHVNPDGGWGDSPESPSNFTTTLLAWCALSSGFAADPEVLPEAEQWLRRRIDPTRADELVGAVHQDYGHDRTFSAPILTVCRLAGKLPDWSRVPQLPFEWAVVPHRFYAWLRLPVVSYALPALIAIGLVRHRRAPSRFVPLRRLRDRRTARCLEILAGMQPESGGFLEAVPLTAFVAMSLAGAGYPEHPVTQACLRFLEHTQRPDGSWPIDVDLSTWLTSLSVRALGNGWTPDQQHRIRRHLLDTQWKHEHPFTHAAPGGWGWTCTPGAVPDADDTPAALLALRRLEPVDEETCRAGVLGLGWLLQLQNRDGGWPTFCKGWGRLPFDRSCPDLTAHVLRAVAAWKNDLPPSMQPATARAEGRALSYLQRTQQPDGSWLPLWFGNQHRERGENPVYGTARVLEALRELDPGSYPSATSMHRKGTAFLLQDQHPDGGWGGGGDTPASIEETALAVGALAGTGSGDARERGVRFLVEHTRDGTCFPPAPIGLYFARLWYSEELYPLVFTVEALGRVHAETESDLSGFSTSD